MGHKRFYDLHRNYTLRTPLEYFISPGIRCKFDLIKKNIGSKRNFFRGLDLGCSGNSFLLFLDNLDTKCVYDIADLPLEQYKNRPNFHPLCGDMTHLPYRDNSFDFITALDVLEHIKSDEIAVSEISRILKTNGIFVLTVPHRMKFFTEQDRLIGHYRRYELEQIDALFNKYNLKRIRTFGVYGRLMRIADFQATDPDKTEDGIEKLREKYRNDSKFRAFWNCIMKISSKVMKLDAKYHSNDKIMNIGFIFRKEEIS